MTPASRAPDGEQEEPPFLFGLIGKAISGSSAAFWTAFRAIDQRVLITIWGGGALVLFLLVVIAATANEGMIGFVKGVFAGLFLALLFAVGFGSLVIAARRAPAPQAAAATGSALDAELAPTLRELNALRTQVIAEVKARSFTRVPVGIVGGLAVWLLNQRGSDPPGVFGFLMLAGLGALAGEMWAAHAPGQRYRRVYKERVLPHVASGLGHLTYRPASRERVAKFAAERILPDHDRLEADDEITGTHDGLAVEIVEVRLKKRVNKKTRVVFDGLLVGVTLPRNLAGTTVVLAERGFWDTVKRRWQGAALEPVQLDHAEFEERYAVYSSDQIEARALLTPAFMERFMALSASGGFAPPGAMADRNTLVVALPKQMGAGDLFEPPPYWQPAGAGNVLVRLQNDIRSVLAMADAVIRLDYWATGRQRDRAGLTR